MIAVSILLLLQIIPVTQVVYGDPSIDSVSPDSGCKGDIIVVKGSMVTAGAVVNIYWDTVSSMNLVNATQALPDGSFEVCISVPEAVNGAHNIWVKDTTTGSTAMYSIPFTINACLVLTPDVGLTADVISFYCYGFSGGADIDSVTFDGASIATSPSSLSTNDLGSASATFEVPDKPYGVHEVYVNDTSSVSAVAYFTVGPNIAFSVTSGPVGALVTVYGRGFYESVAIDSISLGGVACGTVGVISTSTSGSFTGQFIVPTVNSVGTYAVVVTDSMSYSGVASCAVTSLSVLDVDTMFGSPGTHISVTGSKLSALAGENVTLELRDVTTSVVYDLDLTAVTDADGGFTTVFTVPAMDFREYRLVARQDDWNIQVETPFYIRMVVLILSPNEGPVNLEVSLTASGLTEGEPWEAFFGEDRSVASGTVSPGGIISDTFDVPNVTPGVYPVVVHDYATGITVSTDFTVTTIPPLSLTLRVEDAAEGVIVHKLGGDADGPTGYTYVDVVADLESPTDQLVDDVPVVLTVPGDLFGNPIDVWQRDANGFTVVSVAYVEPTSGNYQVEADLTLSAGAYRGQIVWRFRFKDTVSPQDVDLSAEIPFPCDDPDGTATIRILAPESVEGIFVANRWVMYQNYVNDDVTTLLRRLYEEAQGPPLTNSPKSVIYNVERYDNDALNWDNTNVNYASEATANVVANGVDDLIEDWEDDATLYDTFCFGLNCIQTDVDSPEYLLIVGDDQDIPFYRYNDPSDREGILNKDCDGLPGNEHPGWCVDSNGPPNVEPAVWATDNDYILTDNVYADLGEGEDWMIGELEIATGRILGETAADMLTLFENGVSWNNRDTGNVVLASVDGWELGLEPHVGTDVADLHNVSDLFVGLGYEVRNDDIPASEVRTIDTMSPWEGGSFNWYTNFRDAANEADGMDLFFIGGHDSYDTAYIPGNDFVPADTPGTYTRFGIDHPVVMIVGCHGGLPVRTGGGLNGGVNDDLVYDLVHEGASAYIGATGFSYGSPNNIHDCTWAERMFQIFFHELLSTTGTTSNSIGNALISAKREYIAPAGTWDSLSNKTVTEFNLYGVPWAFYFYPNVNVPPPDIPDLPDPHDVGRGTVAPWGADSYMQTYEVNLGLHEVVKQSYDDVLYDLIVVQGGVQAKAHGLPVLPYMEAFTLELPVTGEVASISVSTESIMAPGTYNIPIALVEAFSEGGISYTDQTDIDYLYPRLENLVRYQETSEGLLFTLSPVQYNPATDEVVYHESFTIDIVYKSPIPVAVREVVTDKSVYVPGDTVGMTTTVVNVGSNEVTLTAALTVKDVFGKAIGTKSSEEFTVPSGGSYDVEVDWIQVLGEGSYSATVTVMASDDANDVMGASSTRILMIGDGVKGLTPPSNLRVGEVGEFIVEVVNYGDAAVSKDVSMTIIDRPGGIIILNLPSETVAVEADGTTEVIFHWTPEVPAGSYIAVASVGATYVKEDFSVLPKEVNPELAVALARIDVLETLLDEKEDELVSLTEDLEDANDAISDLESQIQDLMEELENQPEPVDPGKWQQYTYYAAAAAGVLLLLLLLSLRR